MMTEPQVAQHPDGAVTLWVDGHPYLLCDSVEQRRVLYGDWATLWRARAAKLWLMGQTAQAQVWVSLADGAEAMGRRLEERE